MNEWREFAFFGALVFLVATFFAGLGLFADPPPTTEQRERSARIFADKLGLRVVGVSCRWVQCTIAYESGEGVRTLGATCGAESCAGDP